MKILDILREKGTDVLTIGPERTVHHAMRTLVEHNIGSLVVRGQGGEIVGIITERDILRECAKGPGRLQERVVRDAMTSDLIIGVPGDNLDYVMGIMTKNRIRHLPIMDDENLRGIISIGDVVNALRREIEFENRMLKDYIHGVTA